MSDHPSEDEATVRELHDAWVSANTALDGERMRAILAGDCRYFDLNGGLYDGVDTIVQFEESFRALASRHPDAPEGSLAVLTHREPPAVTVEGGVAWVTYVGTLRGILAGNQIEIPFRATEIYRRRAPGWALAHAHFSPLAAPAE